MERDKLTETVGVMIRALRLHRTLCEDAVQGLGIHHSQHRLLMHLSRCECVPSQRELAEAMHISPAALAVTVKKLEHGGFIRRVADKCDKRQNHIEITEKGKNIVCKTQQLFAELDGCMFDGLSETDIDSLRSTLEKTYNNLSERKQNNEKMA